MAQAFYFPATYYATVDDDRFLVLHANRDVYACVRTPYIVWQEESFVFNLKLLRSERHDRKIEKQPLLNSRLCVCVWRGAAVSCAALSLTVLSTA